MAAAPPKKRLSRLFGRDAARAFSASLVACGVAAAIEFALTASLAIKAWTSAGESIAVGTLFRLLLLDLSLWAVFWPVVGIVLALVAVGMRLALRIFAGERALTWPGLLAPSPGRERGATRTAAWLWSLAISATLYVPASASLTLKISSRYNAPSVEALLLGVLQLLLFAAFAGLAYSLYRAAAWVGQRLASRLGTWNPFGRPAPALAFICVFGLIAVRVVMAVRPTLAPLIPLRHLVAGVAMLLGLWLATHLMRTRGALLPTEPKKRLAALSILIFVGAILVPVSLLRVGADAHTKFAASAHSPPLSSLIDLVRSANDFDGDGFGSLLGEGDCAPFDPNIRPGVRDVPDNGIDENCDGRDFSLARLPSIAPGEKVSVPEEFRKPWNFLLITVNTVRYDHTSFGGYIEKKKRDTTPRLAELVERSVSFEFAHAPSAGTMASIPAILTSKFFHSGIALGPDRRGMPPLMKPSNNLLPEILKPAGYYSGAILSHYYFNDWGMNQGFDTYDNEVGKTNEPYKVSSHLLTDRALEWIGRHHKKKWFLWVHYIDPHGRYVAHPGEQSYGDSEEDLYDGELHYADKHVGRLLDELANIPGNDRTIVIVTSDHGDGFNEHGFINHGMALYRELLHVPLIFYVPGANPRAAKGPVTPLDIVPTMAQLAGVDPVPGSFEGRSLVGPLLYGKDDLDRVVFAETNFPKPLRAAISGSYKLIHDLKSNVYQLYDLKKDPWEKRNVWKKDSKGSKDMKRALDDWLERVFYARDFEANQVTQGQLAGVLLEAKPSPKNLANISFDKKRIRLEGYDLVPAGPAAAGGKLEVIAYFIVEGDPSADFQLSVDLFRDDKSIARGAGKTAGGGVFPTSRWRKGDRVRVPLTVRVPRSAGDEVTLTLRLRGTRPDDEAVHVGTGKPAARLGPLKVTGSTAAGDRPEKRKRAPKIPKKRKKTKK